MMSYHPAFDDIYRPGFRRIELIGPSLEELAQGIRFEQIYQAGGLGVDLHSVDESAILDGPLNNAAEVDITVQCICGDTERRGLFLVFMFTPPADIEQLIQARDPLEFVAANPVVKHRFQGSQPLIIELTCHHLYRVTPALYWATGPIQGEA